MKRRRILITGGSGLLALNWACALRESSDIVLGTHRHAVDLAGTRAISLDLGNQHELRLRIDRIRPDVIVHTAGLTNVDQCEANAALAYQANVQIASNVATVAAERGVALVHISTDHLFDGTRKLLDESTSRQPLNEYGRTKALAEDTVLGAHPGALVLRTNFFGWGHPGRQSFSDWLIINLSAGKPLALFEDVHFTPILADRLALKAHALLDAGAHGIFHVVGDERLSKYEFGLKVASRFELPFELISRKKLSTASLVAERPLDMSLDNRKAQHALGESLGTVDQFLLELQAQENEGRRAELFSSVKQNNEWTES